MSRDIPNLRLTTIASRAVARRLAAALAILLFALAPSWGGPKDGASARSAELRGAVESLQAFVPHEAAARLENARTAEEKSDGRTDAGLSRYAGLSLPAAAPAPSAGQVATPAARPSAVWYFATAPPLHA